MSDDDYIPGSPYDGLDDYYWDDDYTQNLADDLAEYTMPSPVYLEDPAYDMMGIFSDWDYYSDDYYDDDPELLKKNPQAGSPPVALRARNNGERKRGRKRKLTETEDIPALSLERPDLTTTMHYVGQNIQGTVWKAGEPEPEEIHFQGEAKRVALLKDWRSVFWESQPKSDRRSVGNLNGKTTLQEAWANNLGLADMGLMNATGKGLAANGVSNDYEQDADEEDSNSADEEDLDVLAGMLEGKDEEDLQDLASDPLTSEIPSAEQNIPSRKRKKTLLREAENRSNTMDINSDIESEGAEQAFSKSKRRKPGSTSMSGTASAKPHVNGAEKGGKCDPEKDSTGSAGTQSTSIASTTDTRATSSMSSEPKSKKRKAAEKNDDNDGPSLQSRATGATVASRAKRIASSKTAVRKDDIQSGVERPPQGPKKTNVTTTAASTRSTRTRKK